MARKRQKYKEEKEIKRLAIYYVGSGFDEKYIEELYPKIRFLADRISRKYYKLSNELDIDETTHRATTEVLMNLRDRKIKPDLEAWTRYIMVRVRKFLPHRNDYKGHNHLFSAMAKYTVDDDFNFSNFEDPTSFNEKEHIEHRLTLQNAIKSCQNSNLFDSYGGAMRNLLIYLSTLSLFEIKKKQVGLDLEEFDDVFQLIQVQLKSSLKEVYLL